MAYNHLYLWQINRKEATAMTEKQKKFLEMVNQAVPHMTEMEQEKLLTFGEALVFLTARPQAAPEAKQEAGQESA